MTISQLETWANSRSDHADQVYVGKNITVADVAGAVQELLGELNDAQDRLWECQDAIDAGCD